MVYQIPPSVFYRDPIGPSRGRSEESHREISLGAALLIGLALWAGSIYFMWRELDLDLLLSIATATQGVLLLSLVVFEERYFRLDCVQALAGVFGAIALFTGALGLAIWGGIYGYNQSGVPLALLLAFLGLLPGGFACLLAGIVTGGAIGFVLELLRWLPRVVFHPRYHVAAWLAFIGGGLEIDL
jgi:hypothetical protein